MIEVKGNTIREAAWEMIQKIQNGEDPRDIIEKQEKNEDGTINVTREETGDGIWQLRYLPSEPKKEKTREEIIREKLAAAGEVHHDRPDNTDLNEAELIGFDLKHRVAVDIIKAERDPLSAIEELIARSTGDAAFNGTA